MTFNLSNSLRCSRCHKLFETINLKVNSQFERLCEGCWDGDKESALQRESEKRETRLNGLVDDAWERST